MDSEQDDARHIESEPDPARLIQVMYENLRVPKQKLQVLRDTEKAEPNHGKIESRATTDTRRIKIAEYLKNPERITEDKYDFKVLLRKEIRTHPTYAASIGFTDLYINLFREDPLLESPNRIKAVEIARRLSDEFAVDVSVISTNKEYYSDWTIDSAVMQNNYFVSEEDPVNTGNTTEMMIRYSKYKEQQASQQPPIPPKDDEAALTLANQKRAEKVTQATLKLGREIAGVKQAYKQSHNGEEPNLSKIAAILNEREVHSPSDKPKKWVAEMVKRVVNRYNSLPDK